MLLENELIVDNFAGGGGTSTGLGQAFGRPVDIAINHDPQALAMHRINHPHTKHYCESVWDVDPVAVTNNKPVGLVWLSPDCKHFSKAKGSKPVDRNVRGLAWVALRWAKKCRPRVIMLENVEEFKTWGPLDANNKPIKARKGETFKKFVEALKGCGYQVDWRILKACDYGAPTIRKRLFLVARLDGMDIVFPKPTHGNPASLAVKKNKLKPWITASECIDWSIPAPSIFERPRPLAKNTCIRIANGIMKFVVNNPKPFILVNTTGHGGGAINSPLHTVTTGNHHAIISPVFTECANTSSPRCMPPEEPLRTICSQIKGGHHALISAFINKHHAGEGSETHLRINAKSDQSSLVAAFLTQYYGNEKDGQELTEPMRTVVSRDRFGLVVVDGEKYKIVDIGFRMLQPRELFRAQGFDDSYVIDRGVDEAGKTIKLTKTAQTRMVGNSVCPPLAKALVEANFTHEQDYKEAI